jgi:CBS domain-containing protein
MQLTVRDWMQSLIIYVEPDEIVSRAIALMRRRYVHSVIVKAAPGTPMGIVTSTDICDKIVAQGKNPTETTVNEIMHSPLNTVPQDMSILDCAARMMELGVHHLPVVGGQGELVGMISSTDFLVVAEAMGNNFKDRSLN